MTTGNVLFVYDTVTDRPGVTLTASSEVQPVSRLTDIRPMRRWISSGCASEWVKVAAPEGETFAIDTLAWLGFNGTVGAPDGGPGMLATTEMSDNADMTSSVLSRTDELWPPVYGLGDELGLYNGGYPELSDFAQFIPFRVVRLGQQVGGAYLRCTLSDPSNPDGQVRLGRWLAGIGWQPSRNFRLGWSYRWLDTATLRETSGGGIIGNRGVKYREWTLSIGSGAIPLEELLAYADDMLRIVGTSRPFLMVLFPDGETKRLYRTSDYVVFKDAPAILAEHPELGSVAQITARGIR